jgi:hypothetical protein
MSGAVVGACGRAECAALRFCAAALRARFGDGAEAEAGRLCAGPRPSGPSGPAGPAGGTVAGGTAGRRAAERVPSGARWKFDAMTAAAAVSEACGERDACTSRSWATRPTAGR